MASFRAVLAGTQDRVHRQQHYESHLKGLTARDRHELFMNQYVRFYGGGKQAADSPTADRTVTDLQTLQEQHKFIRTDVDNAVNSWAVRLAKRYYDKLFKEYAIADLSRYRDSKVGLRWRTEQELLAGKGQFVCGGKGCAEQVGLCSYEVNFGYSEDGERKQALVKLRVCPGCAYKLNYKKEKLFRKVQAKLLRREQGMQQQQQQQKQQHQDKDKEDSEKEEEEEEDDPPRAKRAKTQGAAAPSMPPASSQTCPGASRKEQPEVEDRAAQHSGACVAGRCNPGASAGQEQPRDDGQEGIGLQQAEALADKLLGEEFEQYFEGMFS